MQQTPKLFLLTLKLMPLLRHHMEAYTKKKK